MCGIAALIRLPGGRITPDMIRSMTNAIKHRGPDDEGFLLVTEKGDPALPFGGADTPARVRRDNFPFSPHPDAEAKAHNIQVSQIALLLGHRRLSIIDLAPTGHQPMRRRNQSIWITYNGEIYNYLELRSELERVGYHFETESDTEVILAAYEHWGTCCLAKFNGMFAFLIVDLKEKRLFVARDRFGEKPLYYWQSPNGFLAIASEIKQFMSLPGWVAEANVPRVIDYLKSGLTDFSNETLFKGVFQLRGGHYIESSLDCRDKLMPKKWYILTKTPKKLSFADATQDFYALFEDSVRLRLRADVEIGSCLSGGLDSSAIVCMAHALLAGTGKKNQNTFSACSHIAAFDERHYMEEVISKTGVLPHFVTPSLQGLLDSRKKLLWHQEEPFGSTSIYAQHLVFALVKESGIKVTLDGQGSDEALAGYTSFWPVHFASLLKELRFMTFYQERKLALQFTPSLNLSGASFLKQLLPERLKGVLKSLRDQSSLSSTVYPWINFDSFSREELIEKEIGKTQFHPVDGLSFDQLTCTSLPALLRYEDRNSMAHSIEARTPFLDHRLVEFIFNLPPHYKISNGYTKRILRESLSILPEKIRLRTDKLGFATAEEVWMRKEQPATFHKEVVNAVQMSRGLLNERAIKLADDMIQGKRPFDWTLWRIINLGDWMDLFDVKVK